MRKTFTFILLCASLVACSTHGDIPISSDISLPAFPEASSLATASTANDTNAVLNGTHEMRWAYYTDDDPNGQNGPHFFGRWNNWYISQLQFNSSSDVYALMAIENGRAAWGTVGQNAANLRSLPSNLNEDNLRISIDSGVGSNTSTSYYDVGLNAERTHWRFPEIRRQISGQTVNAAWYFFQAENGAWYIVNLPRYVSYDGQPPRVNRFAAAEDANGNWSYAWQAVSGLDDYKANFYWDDGIMLEFVRDIPDTSSTHTLSVGVDSTARVTSTPSGIDCGRGRTQCDAEFPAGTTVVLESSANAINVSATWYGACTNTGDTCRVTMDEDKETRIRYTSNQTDGYTLSINAIGNGCVRFPGERCVDGATEYSVPEGSVVTLEASPDSGYGVRWGGCPQENGNECRISNMSFDMTVTALFERTQQTSSASVTSISSSGESYVKVSPSGQWLDIRGQGFEQTPTVILYKGNSTFRIDASRTRWISSSHIRIFAGITEAGEWGFDVFNPVNDGSAIDGVNQFTARQTSSGGSSSSASVTSISSSGANYVQVSPSRQWLDIRGQGFERTPTVILYKENNTFRIDASRTRWVDSSHIRIFAGITEAGEWGFDVFNPVNDGSAIDGTDQFVARWSSGGGGSSAGLRGDDYGMRTDDWWDRDANDYYNGQCTAFVAHRMVQDGKTYFIGRSSAGNNGLGHAGDWHTHASRLGGTVVRNKQDVRVGDVAHWTRAAIGGVGHVAYVAAVHGNGMVTIEEYNYDPVDNPRTYSYRTVHISTISNFLRFP